MPSTLPQPSLKPSRSSSTSLNITQPKRKWWQGFVFSLLLHGLLVGSGYLVIKKDLTQLLMEGEVLGVDAQEEATIVATIEEVEEIPPPPPTETPEFIKPEEVKIKTPEPPKPKPPTPKPAVAAQTGGTPQFAAAKPVVGNKDFPKPPYPYEAKKRGWQGSVELWISWDAGGNVIDAKVMQSSGFNLLDVNARDHVRRRWKFHNFSPHRSGSVIVPIRYSLSGQS